MPSPARAMPYTLREASGASCDSTLITSAPMSARYMPAVGPAMRCASSSTRTPSSGLVMAATTYHFSEGGALGGLAAAPAGHQRRGEFRAQDEHDAGVVGEHAETDQGSERAVDPVVDAHAQDVPAEALLGHLPEEGGQQRAREGGSRGHPLVREVAVHDEEERGAEEHGEGERQRADPLGRHLARREHEDADPGEEVEDEDATDEEDAHAEEEDQVFADFAQEARSSHEAEHVVQDETEGGEELAREEQQHERAEDAGEAPAPDDLPEGVVQLPFVDGDDLRELVEHDIRRRLPAQNEAGQRHDEEEDGHQAREEAEGEAGRLEESPVGAKVRDRRAQLPHDNCYTTLLMSPPSTCTTQPVTYDARWEPRKTTMSANSSGFPMRPMGMSGVERVAIHSSKLPRGRAARAFWLPMKRSVWMRPGRT